MDCLRRKNTHELREICRDNPEAWEKLEALSSCRGSGKQMLEQIRAVLTTEAEFQALEELRSLWTILESSGCGDSIRLDFSVGNNMRYYSGVVFRGYLEGIPVSVLSGGQYDRLPQKMGRKSRAIGFAIYVDLLQGLRREENAFDVDTVILHDGSADTAKLMAAAHAAEEKGSVLVTKVLPEGSKWKRLLRFQNGEAVELEAND